jgi:hypothetical protein
MPSFLHISIILKPVSAFLRIRMMCSGENRFHLILSPPVIFIYQEGLNLKMVSSLGERSAGVINLSNTDIIILQCNL